MTSTDRRKSDPAGTGLRFTDVLFGFVFKEIFFRLADWSKIDGEGANLVRVHLLLAAAVTIGSYVGFRKSTQRADPVLRFINLPMIRFVVDQAMVVMYFVLATRTSDDVAEIPGVSSGSWARDSIVAVIAVFVLYVVWDILSLLLERREYEGVNFRPSGLVISISFTMLLLIPLALVPRDDASVGNGVAGLIATIVIVIAYRVVKDNRKFFRLDRLDTVTPDPSPTEVPSPGADDAATLAGNAAG